MKTTEANFHGAAEAAQAIRDGGVSSEELVQACLDRIDAFEGTVAAWAHLDPDLALEQARQADEYRRRGLPLGSLHGVPVGIKDIIDTADLPTEHGTVLHRGRTPSKDATVVSLLRQAGAVIMGKTVTTELAVYSPGKTTNPHDAARTPGGSSSGSAAAVAAFMVPLAVGTQTNGSIIRPASFCGVYGYKPSHGLISRRGVLAQSRPLDTVGVFGRSLADLALIAESVMSYDAADPDMRPRARPQISEIMAEAPPVEPYIAFVRTPAWKDQAEESTKDAFRELFGALGGGEGGGERDRVDIVDLPREFAEACEVHRRIMEADLARSFAREYADGKDKLSPVLCEMIERGRTVLAVDYNGAIERAAEYRAFLDEIFDEYDAIITPSAPGEAPVGLDATGSPVFCTIWTLCGMPALNLPILQGPAGLPVGVQLVSYKGDDARLFRTARWLLEKIAD